MSTINRMIDCPRVTFEDGKPVVCGCEVEITLEIDGCYLPETRWEPAEYPTVSLLNYPDACPETDTKYTHEELAELARRGEQAADRAADEGSDDECGFTWFRRRA